MIEIRKNVRKQLEFFQNRRGATPQLSTVNCQLSIRRSRQIPICRVLESSGSCGTNVPVREEDLTGLGLQKTLLDWVYPLETPEKIW